MANPIAEYLEAVRQPHINNLRALLSQLRAQSDTAVGDMLVKLSQAGVFVGRLKRFDGTFSAPDGPQFRDLRERIPGGLYDLRLRVMIGGDDPCTVSFDPFAWSSCQVQIGGLGADWESLFSNWFHVWLDPDDTKPTDETGLQGVIHSVDEPVFSDGTLRFGVDFGSAPIDAAADLFQRFAMEGGARSFHFGAERSGSAAASTGS
jgi:hypothetical protein